jgi:peptidoglycan/xylan/chitin deacetylase (PgdA/CDA1 family)
VIKHRKKSMAFRMALTALAAMLVAAYLILPGMWQWAHAAARTQAHEIVQIDTAAGPVDAQLIARLRNASTSDQAAPIIITYHDINHIKSDYSVTPESFATQMKMFHDAGWTTLTAAQLDGWLHGKPVPPHSVMITFDDGTGGVWRYADPVLKHYNMHAVAFIITGFVGTHTPYYMTWDMINDLQRSGRWDLEAHTHLGHVYVPSDDHGGKGPFLTTPMWLADKRQMETNEEFHARVLGDLTECKHQFELHHLPVPQFFAYPFSAHEADVAHESVLSQYESGMLDDSHLIQVTSTEDVLRGALRRMDVTWDLSLDGLVRKIELGSPIDPTNARPLTDRDEWTDSDQNPTNMLSIDGDRITVDPGPGGATSVQYARIRTTMWSNYTVSADLVFDPDTEGTTTGLSMFVGNIKHEVIVTMNHGHYSVSFGNSEEDVASGDLDSMPVYHLDITATPTIMSISINGQPLPPVVVPPDSAHGPREVGGGIGIISHRASDTSPVSVISNLTIK